MNEAAAQAQNHITPYRLYQLLGQGRTFELLDVRTPGEFAVAHVPGARLVPLHELDAAAFLKYRNTNGSPIYVLCQSGGRARKAVEKFHCAGFDDCVLVEGGMQAWMDAGLPLERSKRGVLPLMRQVQIAVGLISTAGATLALTVNSWFAVIPLITGGGLLFAGLTGFCGLAHLLARMPWNQVEKAVHANKQNV